MLVKNLTINRSVLALCLALLFATGCSRIETTNKAQSINAVTRGSEELANAKKTQADTAQLLALAEASYNAKDWEAAEKNYVAITQAIPKEAHPWFRLGNIYARTERPDFAVRAYKEALLRDSSLSKAWYNMGLVQLRQSANSFLQMRTYTPENSSAQERADAMYESIIDVIKHGPQQATTFPLSAPSDAMPKPTALPVLTADEKQEAGLSERAAQAQEQALEAAPRSSTDADDSSSQPVSTQAEQVEQADESSTAEDGS